MAEPTSLHPDGFQSAVDVDERGRVFQVLAFPGGVDLVLRAERLKQERGAVHAKLSIILSGEGEYVLAWDNFNIERAEDRIRLSNRAHLRLGKTAGSAVGKDLLASHVDAFCEVAWTAHVGASKGGWTAPAAERVATALLTPWWPLRGGVAVFAPPGSAKTFLGLATAVTVQYGISTLWPVMQANMLYVNLERSERSMQQRLLAVCEALGIEPVPLLMLHARGASMTDIEDIVSEMVSEHKVEGVIWDSLSRFGGGTLNDDAVMNRAMDMCNRTSPSWELIGHTPRADHTHGFGSVMQDAAADVLLQVTSETLRDLTKGVGLNITKANDIPEGPRGIFALEFDRRMGLTGIRPARAGEFVEIEGAGKRGAKDRIRAYVRDNGAQSADEVADALHLERETVARAFGDSGVYVKAGTLGRKQLYGILRVE